MALRLWFILAECEREHPNKRRLPIQIRTHTWRSRLLMNQRTPATEGPVDTKEWIRISCWRTSSKPGSESRPATEGPVETKEWIQISYWSTSRTPRRLQINFDDGRVLRRNTDPLGADLVSQVLDVVLEHLSLLRRDLESCSSESG